MGSEARDGRGALSRTSQLENKGTLTPPYQIPSASGSGGGFDERCFSYAGVLALGESPPWEPPYAIPLREAVCRLGTTGTDTTTVSINVNGISIGSGDMAAGVSRITIALSGILNPVDDTATVEITDAGTLAESLTVHLRT